MSLPKDRLRFNEIATLLERLEPARLAGLLEQFPAFAEETKRGPDAGLAAAADWAYHAERAAYTSALCKELIPAIEQLANRTIERTSSLNASRTIIAILAAIGGTTTLGAFGIGKEEVARISGIVTSGVAVINAGVESLTKRFTSTETQKAIELKAAALQLSQLRHDLDLAVKHERDLKAVASAIEKCNQVALDLNQRKDQLRIA